MNLQSHQIQGQGKKQLCCYILVANHWKIIFKNNVFYNCIKRNIKLSGIHLIRDLQDLYTKTKQFAERNYR